MARYARNPDPYQAALMGHGVAPPANAGAYVRDGGPGGAQVAPRSPYLTGQASAAYHPGYNDAPQVLYNPNYHQRQLQKHILAGGSVADYVDPYTGHSLYGETQQANITPEQQNALSLSIAEHAQNASPEQLEGLSRGLSSAAGFTSSLTYAQERRRDAALTQSAMSDYKDQLAEMRNRRQGARDLQQARLLYERGTIRDSAYEQVVQDLIKKNPAAMGTPEYAQFAGTEKELIEQRQLKLKGFAELHGAPLHHVQWDEKADAPKFNNSAVAYDAAKINLQLSQAKAADLPQKNMIAAQKSQMEAIQGQLDTVSDSIKAAKDSTGRPAASDLALQRELQKQLFTAQSQFRNLIVGAAPQQAQVSPEQSAAAERLTRVREQAAAAFQKYPKLPQGARFMGELPDVATARRSTPPNSYAAIGGQLLYRDANGKFAVVQ